MTSTPPAIRVAGLSKRFGAKQVLADVGFEVASGTRTVLIGPAASGKSVLMKCLAGIHRPDAGSIEINGMPAAGFGSAGHADLMDKVGVLFQQGGLFDSLPVWENISFKLLNRFGITRAEAREIAVEKLALVNLPASTADLLPSELSGGMQKRAGIARALAGEPELLLLDEPTAGLDPITTATINRLIDASIRDKGTTVFSITSDMESARTAYDHLIMLNEGRAVWSGKTSDIEDSGNPYVLQLIHGRAEGPIKMRLRARA